MAVLGLLACVAPAARAQFGRNQVQYQTFNFQVMRTEHFDIYFYEEERPTVEVTARMAERWYDRLSRVLDHQLRGRQPLILYASAAQFQQTNAISGGIGEGTGGVTEGFKRRIVMPLTGSLAETDHVLGHELVHAFQYDITGMGRFQAPGVAALPLWFVEGMAEYFSVGPVDAQTAMWIRDAAEFNRLPKISQLDDPRYFPYRFGHALWAYIGARWGDEVIAQLLRAGGRQRDPLLAISNVLGVQHDSLSAQWHASIRSATGPVTAERQAPGDTGAAGGRQFNLLNKRTTGGELSLGPALSPDGSRVVFLSERGLFSVEAFVADAATGRVQRRLTRTATDPHVESLLFIYSAGSWHPDGDQFVYGATVRGRPALEVVRTGNGERVRRVRLPDLDEVFNPAFSPDGRRVAFTGNAGGQSDLYVYDFAAGAMNRLTTDVFADLQPVWSPDGAQLAFVTDRFGTDVAHLTYGPYRLAIMNMASGAIREVPAFSRGKHINPQWSPDGRSLFFLGDPDGVPNVYRVELASGSLFRVTNLTTGASGITAASPALSVAARAERLAVTVYRDGKHEVVRLDGAALAGEPVSDTITAQRTAAATLPPGTTPSTPSRVASYLADARTGLPAQDTFPVVNYSPRFGLDYVAQPYLAASVSSFGTFVGGGVTMYWSSMLGDRQLATMFSVNGGLRDIAAEVQYINLSRRADWGILASQIPIRYGFYQQGFDPSNGDYVQQQTISRQTSRVAMGMLSYPFSRVQRLELAAGVQQIGFDIEVQELRQDQTTGSVTESKRSLPAPDALTMGVGTAALVFDNSLFGGTGPVLGRRWRLEVTPMIGSLDMVGVLVDFRQYLMPVRPLTLAGRLVHTARYGADAADGRLTPLFLGYQTILRGYDNNSFSFEECDDPTASCPVFDQLLGDQGMLVGNVEARLPILGPLGVLTRRALPPLDLFAFSDAGVVWSRGEQPAFLGGTRNTVVSYGVGARVNLFGFIIGELAYVNPVDRPRKGWWFQLGFTPGF